MREFIDRLKAVTNRAEDILCGVKVENKLNDCPRDLIFVTQAPATGTIEFSEDPLTVSAIDNVSLCHNSSTDHVEIRMFTTDGYAFLVVQTNNYLQAKEYIVGHVMQNVRFGYRITDQDLKLNVAGRLINNREIVRLDQDQRTYTKEGFVLSIDGHDTFIGSREYCQLNNFIQ